MTGQVPLSGTGYNLPAALAAYLKNAKRIGHNIGANINTAPLSLPPALAQGATTPLGGRPSSFNESILQGVKAAGQGAGPVGEGVNTDNTHYDPNAFLKAIQAEANDNELQALGKDGSSHHSSLLQKAFHVLSAPEHALLGGTEDAAINAGKGHGIGGIISGAVTGGLRGAKEGLTGHGTFANQDWGDAINLASNRNGITVKAGGDTGQALTDDIQKKLRIGGGWQHALGTVGDVVLDPLNFVGVAPVAKLGEGVRGIEGLNDARRAISIKAGSKALPILPLPKKAELASVLAKLPGNKGAHLAEGMQNFTKLAEDTAKTPSNVDRSLKGIIEPKAQEAIHDNYLERTAGTEALQARHPYLTKISHGFSAPSKTLGATLGRGPQGLLGVRGKITALDNEERRQILQDYKGVSPQDNKQLLATLKSQGYGPLAQGHVVAATAKHENVAPVFARHVETSRMIIEDYLKHGGSVDHLNNELRHLQAPQLTAETVDNPKLWQLWLSGIKGPDDASHLAYSLRNAADHAVAKNDLADMLKANHGYDLRKHKITKGNNKGKYALNSAKVNQRIAAGYAPVDHPLFRDAEGNATHLFHPDVSSKVENLFKLLSEPLGKSHTNNPFIKLFDRSQNNYKRAVTVYNPGSHSRYLLSSVLQNHINGLKNPYNYIKAARVILHHDPEAKYRTFLGHVDPDILRMPNYKKAAEGKGFVVHNSKRLGRSMTDQELFHDMSVHGLGHNFVHAQLSPDGLRGGGKLNRLNEGLLRMGESRDNIPRLAMYMDALERAPKGLSDTEAKQWAADQVLASAHNFSDLTRFERDKMQRLIPFYADIRKNLPMVMKSIFTHPGRVAAYPLALQEAEEGSGGLNQESNPLFNYLTPDYLMSSGAVPVGHHGDNPVFLNQKNHLSDLFYQLGGQPLSGSLPHKIQQEGNFLGRQFGLSTLTPALRVPAEIAAGRQFYSGNPITNNERYITQQLPLSNAINKIFENRSKGQQMVNPGNPLLTPALINYLTGLGLSENSPVQQQAAANSKAIPSKKEIQKAIPISRVP